MIFGIEKKKIKKLLMTDLDYYFDSYSLSGIHVDMLSDKIRTESYKEAIFKNPSLFKDKIILDVGCGTGILSMFAASCGAKRVYAVDNSSIINTAKKIVADNNLQDKIEFIQGKIEEIQIPEQVDVIISEWMGYCLLFESMLPSVLIARDKFMKPTGTMFPNKAEMKICGFNDTNLFKSKIQFWDDIEGFNLSAFKKWSIYEPLVYGLNSSNIITDEKVFKTFDLNKCKIEDLSFTSDFKLNPLDSTKLHGLCVSFNTTFEGPEATVVLETSPFYTQTHWMQTLFVFENSVDIDFSDNISGVFTMKPCERNVRDMDVNIIFNLNSSKIEQKFCIR